MIDQSINHCLAGDGGGQGDSGQRPAVVLPLAGKVIYLDVQKRTPKMMDRLRSDLVDLGGVSMNNV